MINDQFQVEMFDKETFDLDFQKESKPNPKLGLIDADVEYYTKFIADDQAWAFYQKILEQTELTQDPITVYGKQHLTPRLTCWMGDQGLDYRYSHFTMKPVAWSPVLLELKAQLEKVSDHRFNSVLINYYRDGQDSNGWHCDDEPELGQNPVIASLSLGAARDFHLRHKTKKQHKHSICLEHGSLLMMYGTTQKYWQHHIPKRAKAEGRINLTFRKIIV